MSGDRVFLESSLECRYQSDLCQVSQRGMFIVKHANGRYK